MTSPPSRRSIACAGCGAVLTDSIASGLCAACLARRWSDREGLPADATRVGRALPRGFEPIDELGRGGMGVVTLAFQRSLSRYVALKQLGGAWQHDARARERFLREARATARLSHPGIVPILEIGESDDELWFTMEYLEGGDVDDLLAHRGGQIPWREAVELVARVAAAMQHAHNAGVVHRDLKPSNILLDAAGQPKVCDFGLAWLASREGRDLTVTGEIVGTPAYLAPESLSGARSDGVNRSTDIYALGTLLFHLVAGRPPFIGDTPMQVLGAISRTPAPRLSDVTGGRIRHPPQLDAICARSLEKDPADRFRSAGEIANALQDCLELRGRLFPRLRRRTARAIAVAAAIGVLLVGFAAVIARVAHQRVASMETHAPDRPLVVVRPLRALTADDATRALAAGLQDELVAAITRISDLRVISARSARAAAQADTEGTNTRAMLGASAALDVSIQRFQNSLRIIARVVDTADESKSWTQTFDRLETNIFNLQTDIATAVAVHLKVTFLDSRESAVRGTSSTVPAAQRAYFRARELAADASDSIGQIDLAEQLLSSAIAADPTFAIAFAQLSLNHTLKYHWGNDRAASRLRLGLDAALEAIRLNPDLPEAEVALGAYYLRGTRDYATARPHLERALELAPNNAAALENLANVDRRQGLFESSARRYLAALELDPLNPILAYNCVDTHLRLRDYETASDLLEHALSVLSGHVALMKLRGDLHLAWKGDLGPMRADIESRDPALPSPEVYLAQKIDWLVLEHRLEEAISALDASSFEQIDAQSIYLPRSGYRALLCQLAGRRAEAETAARDALAVTQVRLDRNPDDPRLLRCAGEMHAILGEVALADHLIRRTFTPGDPACVDAFDRAYYQHALAIQLALAGRADEALTLSRSLLSGPSPYSKRSLALHPAFRDLANRLPEREAGSRTIATADDA